MFDALSQPSTSTLPGNFRETAMFRNPNNTGPVRRIFAVTVEDTLWKEMEQYGQMMPYNKYGTTTVFFFRSGQPSPDQLEDSEVPFSEKYFTHCIGKYHKDAMGNVSFVKFPQLP